MNDELKATCLPVQRSAFSVQRLILMSDENRDDLKSSAEETRRRQWWKLSLTAWIMIGLVAGGVLGYVKPSWGNAVFFLRDIFLNLIKSIIAPLVFSTLVVGIAGG